MRIILKGGVNENNIQWDGDNDGLPVGSPIGPK